MNNDFKDLLALLPPSGLSNKEIQAIREVFPVPKEQIVLWAKVISLIKH